MDDLGSKLKSLRIARNLTQLELAEELGLSKALVSHWECNNRVPDYYQLINICKALNVTLDYFSDKTDDQQLFETLAQLSNFFQSEGVPELDKDKAYHDIMAIYLKSKMKGRDEENGNANKTDADRGSADITKRI